MMKKCLAVALVFVLLAGVALADFDGQTLEQLQTAAARLQAEILRRTGEPFTVDAGIYVVGVDIPAGVYRVELKNGSGFFRVFNSEKLARENAPFTYTFDAWMVKNSDLGVEALGKVTLRDGEALLLDVTAEFSVYKGVGW